MLSNVDPNTPLSSNHVVHPWTSWAAVLAGVTTAIAVQIGLTELCLASGLLLFQPTEPGSETTALAVGTVVALLVCALISVFLGGWIAGRMKYHESSIEAAVHGMLVWAVGSIAVLLLTTMTIGILAGGAFSLLGLAVSGAAKGAGAALPEAVEAVAPSWDAIKKDIESAIDKRDADSKAPLLDNRFADRSRLMQLLAQSFSMDGESLSDADRDELTGLLATQLDISPEAARATYEQWQSTWQEGLSRFEAAKEDALRVAKNAAETAAARTAQAALVAFFAMIVALGAAIAGALCGSACAMKCIKSRTAACAPDRVPS